MEALELKFEAAVADRKIPGAVLAASSTNGPYTLGNMPRLTRANRGHRKLRL